MPDHRTYQDSFYGWTIPKAVSVCTNTLKECNLPPATIQQLLSMSESQILGTSPSIDTLADISEKHSISIEQILYIFNGFVHVLKLALKTPAAFLKSEIFKDDLKELKFSESIIQELNNILFGPRREQLYSAISEHNRPRLPSIKTFDWNLDVTLTTGSLSRCVEPLLLFQFRTNDDKVSTFEVPIKAFNELRYNTALAIKEMEDIDNKAALKLLET